MHAITVTPATANSLTLVDALEPAPNEGSVLVTTQALGICGTDIEIVRGAYGSAPEGMSRLVIGHESLGRVLSAPASSGLTEGDWVVGIVRRPDPVPCEACASGEWDMCRNGRYRERGIRGLNGYGSSRFRIEPEFAIKIDPSLGLLGVLLEPTSVVAKAWDQTERIARRAHWKPARVLVTGAGPVGLLAALLGRQRGYEVHVLDRVQSGPKPQLVADLGATYHSGDVTKTPGPFDFVFECTGAVSVLADVMQVIAPVGIVCLAGVSDVGRLAHVDLGALNRELVLDNVVIFGSVNANVHHYRMAADALAMADKRWLDRLLTRRVPLERFHEAFVRQPDDVKTVITFER